MSRQQVNRAKRKEKAFGAAALYLAAIAGAFFVFPDYQSEDDPFLPQPILNGWRSAISLSMTAFWFSLGIIAGLLWTCGSRRWKRLLKYRSSKKLACFI